MPAPNTEDILTDTEQSTAVSTRAEGGKFVKGVSGNPAGRPKKQQLKDLQQDLEIALREHITVDKVKRIINRMVEKAEGGHVGAAKLILDKVISNARDSDDAGANDGRTVVFRIENATFAAQQAKTQTPIEVIDVSVTEVTAPSEEKTE